jgi:hypothetical protein
MKIHYPLLKILYFLLLSGQFNDNQMLWFLKFCPDPDPAFQVIPDPDPHPTLKL